MAKFWDCLISSFFHHLIVFNKYLLLITNRIFKENGQLETDWLRGEFCHYPDNIPVSQVAIISVGWINMEFEILASD